MFEDIVSIIIVIALIQCGLLILLLLTQKGRNPNKYLIGILAFLFWTQLEFLFVRNRMQFGFILLFATRLGSWLVLGPLFFLYIRTMLNSKFSFGKREVLHFVPFIFFTLIYPFVARELLPDRAIHYGILSLLKYYHLGTTPMQALYADLFIFQFVHLLAYLIVSKNELSKFSFRLKSQFSNLEKINTQWINNLLIAFVLVLISVTIFFVILFVFNIYEREFDYLYVLPTALVIYWIAFKIIRQPEIIRNIELASETITKYKKSSLTLEKANKYKGVISAYMESEKPYLNNELKLSELAEALGIHPHHLSQILNDQFNLSFFDFINQYRVEEAKRRFKKKNGETILQIAYEVGFNNKASFNNYFKKVTNTTPSKFIKEYSN